MSLSHPYGDEPVYTPTTAQIAAVEQLLTNEKSTHALIAGKLLLFAKRELRHLPSDVELPRGVSHETLDAKKLSKLISLRTIHVSFELERKRSAIGFQYECAWEPEHGLGVSLDGKRVTLGHADVAFG
ncbi:MAG: hypothetical protein U0165_04750 [Polyangiaceae bacterium]